MSIGERIGSAMAGGEQHRQKAQQHEIEGRQDLAQGDFGGAIGHKFGQITEEIQQAILGPIDALRGLIDPKWAQEQLNVQNIEDGTEVSPNATANNKPDRGADLPDH